jgi:hypothetical protein
MRLWRNAPLVKLLCHFIGCLDEFLLSNLMHAVLFRYHSHAELSAQYLLYELLKKQTNVASEAVCPDVF